MKEVNELYDLLKSTLSKGRYVVEIDAATKKKVDAYEQALRKQVEQIKSSNNFPAAILEKRIKISEDIRELLIAERDKGRKLFDDVLKRHSKKAQQTGQCWRTDEGAELIECQNDELERIVCHDISGEVLSDYFTKMNFGILRSDSVDYELTLKARINKQFGDWRTLKTAQEQEANIQNKIKFLLQERQLTIKATNTKETNETIREAYEERARIAYRCWEHAGIELTVFQEEILHSSHPTDTPTPLLLSAQAALAKKPASQEEAQKDELEQANTWEKVLALKQYKGACDRLKEHLKGLKNQVAGLNIDIRVLEAAREKMFKQNKVFFWRILDDFITENHPGTDKKPAVSVKS